MKRVLSVKEQGAFQIMGSLKAASLRWFLGVLTLGLILLAVFIAGCAPGAMKIELEPLTASLTIGDDYAKKNTIEFTIKLTGNDKVWLTLQIPVGENGVLRQPEDANAIVVATPGNASSPLFVPDSSNTTKEWRLGDYDTGVQVSGSTELSVKISNILCLASAQPSEITIIGKTDSSPDEIKAVLKIEKAKPTEAANPILYFIAEPTYLIGSGDVTLTWDVTGDETVTLETLSGMQTMPPTPSSYPDNGLSKTWTYTLRAGNNQRQVTVNVLTEGWHKLYPCGKNTFPSVIFDAAGRTADMLYAIFVRDGTGGREAVLCKSADGITGWQVIDEAVPDGMESSPGVQLGNRLWLIGGSAVDPARISNRICYYDLARPNEGWRDAVVTGFDDGARMGHACVIVDDNTIWMLGGLGKYGPLNDVWSLTIGDSGETVTAEQLAKKADWSPRCMFSAVNFNNMIWVCGGVSSPNGNPLGDLWGATKSSNIAWEKRPTGANGSVVANAISTGAAACGDTLFTLITNRTGGPNWRLHAEMWTIGKSGITTTSDAWAESSQQLEFPTNLLSTPHSIAVVGFKNRLYVRRLYRSDMYGKVVGAPLYVYVQSYLKSRE